MYSYDHKRKIIVFKRVTLETNSVTKNKKSEKYN